jgi:hypothetical protein
VRVELFGNSKEAILTFSIKLSVEFSMGDKKERDGT